MQHGQTGAQTEVFNLSTFKEEEFAIINPIVMSAGQSDLQFYQMGEEGNPRDAYELHCTRFMKRLIFRDFTIATKYPNNIVLVNDLGVCVVSDISLDKESDSFQVKLAPFVKQADFFKGSPCDSSSFHIYMVSGGVDNKKRKSVNANDIVNQFVCLLYKRVVDIDADIAEEARQHPSDVARVNLDKTKSIFVCIPLMHALFE